MASTRTRCFVVLLLFLIALSSALAVPVAREENAPAKKGQGLPSKVSSSSDRSHSKKKPSSIKLPLPARLKSKVATPKATGRVKGSLPPIKAKGKLSTSSTKGKSAATKVSSKSPTSKSQQGKGSNSHHKNGRKTSHVSKKNRKNRKGRKKHHRDIDNALKQHAPSADNEGRSMNDLDTGSGHGSTLVNPPAPYFVTSAHKILEAEPFTYTSSPRGQNSHAADIRVAPTVPGTKSPIIEHESHSVLKPNLPRSISPLDADDESSNEPRALLDLELGHVDQSHVVHATEEAPLEQLGITETDGPITVPQALPAIVQHVHPAAATDTLPFSATVAPLYQSSDRNRPLLEINVRRESGHDGQVQARAGGDRFVTHPSLIHMAGAKPHAAHAQSDSNNHPGEAVHGPFILHPSLINVGGGRVHTADEGVKNHAKRQVEEHHKHNNANGRPSLLDPVVSRLQT